MSDHQPLPLIRRIEKLLEQYGDALFEINGRSTHWWRALILTFHSRYGAGKSLATHSSFQHPGLEANRTLRTELRSCCIAVKAACQEVQQRLATRSGDERVQMQFPIHGDSLLCITHPRSREHACGLNALLAAALHSEKGIEGVRKSEEQSHRIPYQLPEPLQPDKLPKPHCSAVPAKSINELIRRVYDCFNYVDSEIDSEVDTEHGAIVPAELTATLAFVKRFNLHREHVRETWGLPNTFEAKVHGYETFVPEVTPGEQVILWNTWHTTTGSDTREPKITVFCDAVPSAFLTPNQAAWYRYVAEHAPCDMGAGYSRGSWQMFVQQHLDCLKAHETGAPEPQYGLPDNIMRMWQTNASAEMCKREKKYRLTSEQLATFHAQGYLVLNVPKKLLQKCPPKEMIQHFSRTFGTITQDPGFDFRQPEHMLRVEKCSVAPTPPPSKRRKPNASTYEAMSAGYGAQEYWSHLSRPNPEAKEVAKYHYYTPLINIERPLDPAARNTQQPYSKNAQRGGKLICADNGMGPGTTVTNEKYHVRFQFSPFVTGIMQSFYAPPNSDDHVPLLRVLERFRVKTTTPWKRAVHVDTDPNRWVPSVQMG
jgi:hypothetical protein